MNAALLYPGQGAQEVGMGSSFLNAFPSVRERIAQASDRMSVDLAEVMQCGPRSRLASTDLAQPAIFVLSYAIAELLAERGIGAACVAGHSLGQFTAAAACGALSFESALDIVIRRASLMHEVNCSIKGGMLVVSGLPKDMLEMNLAGHRDKVWIANINAPSQIALAGLSVDLKDVASTLTQAGARLTWLDVAGPYHSPLFAEAASAFSAFIAQADIRNPVTPLVANSSGSLLQEADVLRSELRAHMLSPVDWVACMARVQDLQCTYLIEVGPGRTMKGLALRNTPRLTCLTTSTVDDFDQTCRQLESLACAS